MPLTPCIVERAPEARLTALVLVVERLRERGWPDAVLVAARIEAEKADARL